MRTAVREARRDLYQVLGDCSQYSRLTLLVRDVSQSVSWWARKNPKLSLKQTLNPDDLLYIWDRFFYPGMLSFIPSRGRWPTPETLQLLRVTLEVIRDYPLVELVTRHYIHQAVCHQTPDVRPLRFVERLGQIELQLHAFPQMDDENLRLLVVSQFAHFVMNQVFRNSPESRAAFAFVSQGRGTWTEWFKAVLTEDLDWWRGLKEKYSEIIVQDRLELLTQDLRSMLKPILVAA